MNILSPIDGAGVEVGAVRIIGATSGTMVNISGIPVDLAAGGKFEYDLVLREGVNLLEVVASNSVGVSTSRQLVVFFISPVVGLPLTLLYPADGLEVTEPVIKVVGVTRPDAVVGVNEVPAEVNALGIFSIEIPLVEEDNLIEVVAVDVQSNVRFQTIVVFYLP